MGKGKSKEADMFDMAFEMKMNAKTLDKQADKIGLDMRKERKKCYDYMNKGQQDNARISAENCIRMQ